MGAVILIGAIADEGCEAEKGTVRKVNIIGRRRLERR
jgi:hypothetical protein